MRYATCSDLLPCSFSLRFTRNLVPFIKLAEPLKPLQSSPMNCKALGIVIMCYECFLEWNEVEFHHFYINQAG